MSKDEIMTEGYALSEIHKRLVTSIIIILLASVTLFAGSWLLLIAIMAIAALMDKEWSNITPRNSIGWKLAGIFYITLPCIAALALRDLSFAAILYPIMLIVATDIGAYVSGRAIGGPKIIAAISPNKTWAGLGGGMVGAVVVSVLMHSHVPFPESTIAAIFIGVFTAILAQAGDFFESWLKRKQGVKDSGTLLPGHGGLLDRLDGYIIVLPAYLLYLIIAAEVAA